ncbi:hypothetical protein OUZ56_017522 [Daphnia magna]|uniref:Uncharacterized protein n=1 Tax=Daphnia magna TaxID=35525 RepID=A0ABR0ASZ1_9CRUS|nr:hypothetical protein OUZ56_017522 [Daphnia magna]
MSLSPKGCLQLTDRSPASSTPEHHRWAGETCNLWSTNAHRVAGFPRPAVVFWRRASSVPICELQTPLRRQRHHQVQKHIIDSKIIIMVARGSSFDSAGTFGLPYKLNRKIEH